uniref:Uncharacterized protein n=1 Tax=Heterorhabditis bacteriophora TaxID=37862 RepID=A0A1I7X4C4_HETBA
MSVNDPEVPKYKIELAAIRSKDDIWDERGNVDPSWLKTCSIANNYIFKQHFCINDIVYPIKELISYLLK